MIFLSAQEPPKLPPLIEIVIEKPKEEPTEIKQEEPVITWRDNPQGCNEDTHYIAAESPFYCIPKQNTSQRQKAVKQAPVASQTLTGSPPLSWWDYHSCTWYVASKRSVGFWNSASSWLTQAQRDGWATGSTPKVGAIGWEPGHVVYIEAVDGDRVYISERNYDYNGGYRERWASASEFTYIY